MSLLKQKNVILNKVIKSLKVVVEFRINYRFYWLRLIVIGRDRLEISKLLEN